MIKLCGALSREKVDIHIEARCITLEFIREGFLGDNTDEEREHWSIGARWRTRWCHHSSGVYNVDWFDYVLDAIPGVSFKVHRDSNLVTIMVTDLNLPNVIYKINTNPFRNFGYIARNKQWTTFIRICVAC